MPQGLLSILMSIVTWLSKGYILLLLAAICIIVALFMLFQFQSKRRREIEHDLKLIDSVSQHNIEFELVLKAMKLSTWKYDIATAIFTKETDFRNVADLYTSEENIPFQQLLSVVAPWHRELVEEAFRKISEGEKETFHIIFQIKGRHNDVLYWIESHATVAEATPEGKPIRLVGTSTCIDKRKALEDELIRARNKAEESDKLKSAFLTNIGHEVHTPLNAIVGFSEMLPQAETEEERQEMLRIIHESNQQLLKIFDDMVLLSEQAASGKSDNLEMEMVDIGKLIEESARQFSAENKNEQVAIYTHITTGDAKIKTNCSRLSTILSHLLDNALKFTERGSVTIGSSWQEGDMLRIFVKDTGIGIAREDQERIFESFTKLNSFTQGMGLGLSVCRTFTYSLGGSIGVVSSPGVGSTFWVDLPLS